MEGKRLRSEENFYEQRKKARDDTSEKPLSPPTTTAEQDHSERVIFMIEPFQTGERNEGTSQPANFLERCHFCKKVPTKETDIYMYRCFLAFCSPMCRLLYAVKEDGEAEEELKD